MTLDWVPFCPKCRRFGRNIPEYIEAVADLDDGGTEMTVDEYIRDQEGTYNPNNGHFLCTDCYIKAGMPSTPLGWMCP